MPAYLEILTFYIPSGLVLLTMGLYLLSYRLPFLTFYARLIASYLSLVACALYGVAASIFLRLIGYGRVSQWATARSFKWVMRYTTGIKFEIEEEGRQWLRERPVVFVGNHQTELDILMLGTIFPPYCSVTAKSSLKLLPFLGWFMALSGTVFIDRRNRSTAFAAFDGAAKEMLTHRQSVFIFPEGTRSYSSTPDMLPFKKGAFHLAIKAQVPIVPVVVANYSDVLNVKKRIFRAGTVPVRVLKPISTKGLNAEDVDELTTSVREEMLKVLREVTETSRENGVALGFDRATKADGAVRASGRDVQPIAAA